MRYLLIMLVACLPLLAGAVEFDESTRSLSLGRWTQVLEDASGQADIKQISSAEMASAFRPLGEPTLNAGYSRSAFWMKIDLSYVPRDAQQHSDWLLELAYPPMDHVDVYLIDAQGEQQMAWKTGDMLPFASRQIRQNNYLFELPLKPGQTMTAYVRVASNGSVQAPLNLWSSHAYLEEQPARIYVLGLIYGVLLGMLVYNLFIYVSVRDTSYLYYILYIASFGLYQVSINGAAIEYLWPDSPWWANAATPFLIGASVLFASQFTRSFLQSPLLGRWVDNLLLWVMGSAVLVIALALFADYGLALRMVTLLVLVFTVVVFTTGITAWLRGVRVARYFLLAWSAFLLGGLVNAVMLLGYLPNTFLTMYASQIGSVIEVALLSLALADRINYARELQARTLLEAGRDLERLNQQLATSNRLKDEFLATLTHELRTPMNGIIGSLDLMQTVPLDGEVSMYQQTASASAQDMMRMINGILTLTELQAGVLHAECGPFELPVLTHRLHQRFIGPAQAKGLRLSFEVDPFVPRLLRGDAEKLYQCIECLMDNAIKFTRHGTVTLRMDGMRREADHFTLRIEVIDTGIGFSRLNDAVLYQRFFQADSSMTREYGGLGIGLAICRQLIELLGGSLSHHSEPGRGSRFCLSLPLQAQSLTTAGARQGKNADNSSNMALFKMRGA
ncbi:ATP-binding protein [Pseudomonas sp. 21LCFQ02]|uniref:sensor histidine kinase n=1 Tax=unclassified Pseudomonas TaxID=196821 RepID=UPI0004F7C613|nr:MULTISPECIES: 7TM diverse intracellular signaling domain-containing protein [unclassified Pseudomonas]MCO8170185.1 ATP-binding protein [Pseudomonas sp. 21LCFQ02]MCQ9424614.1 ATP-binding protein [Pseudomonas sp. LJDD11]BAP43303.1 sensor histidine kinase [Pseudomonas sp. StFLB209]